MKEVPPQAEIGSARERFRRDQAKPCQQHGQNDAARHALSEQLHRLPLPEGFALGIGEFIHHDKDQVHDGPDAAATEGDELQNPQPDVTQVKPVQTCDAQEADGRKDESGHPILLAGRRAQPHAAFHADFGAWERLLPADLAKARAGERSLPSGHAEFGIVRYLSRAIPAIHDDDLARWEFRA